MEDVAGNQPGDGTRKDQATACIGEAPTTRFVPAASLVPQLRQVRANTSPSLVWVTCTPRLPRSSRRPQRGQSARKVMPASSSCRCSSKSDYPLLLPRSEEHTSELQSLMRISYAVF